MIPWKSSNEMMLCVASDQCLIAIADGPPTVPLVKGGQIRALAVTGSERSEELPDVPSMGELGFPEVNTKLWSGFFAPAATPPAIARKLETALRTAIKAPDVADKLKAMAVHPGGNSSDEFRKVIDADIKAYVEVVKAPTCISRSSLRVAALDALRGRCWRRRSITTQRRTSWR
jgi:tripartite-type tricarboxylate transporter receptor subunit TctC